MWWAASRPLRLVGCCCGLDSGLVPHWRSRFAFWPVGVCSQCRGKAFPLSVGEPRGCTPIWPRCFRPWRISNSSSPMPRSSHPSAGTIHASGGNSAPGLADSVDLSACLLSWWQAHGRRDPQQKPWMFNPAGGWPEADHQLDPYGIWIAEVMLQQTQFCLLYTSPSPRDATLSRMPSSA